jgi:NADH dehydrogenase
MARVRASTTVLAAAGGAALLLLARQADRRATGVAGRRASEGTGSGPRRRVVIVGAGFGGLQAARRLAREPGVALTVIDTHNHHVFQPLLYQVATAALSPSDIASPVRSIVPVSDRHRVLMATVTGVDAEARRVLCEGESVPYDELILATGSRPSYFGHAAWAEAAPGLKTLDDAVGLRQAILEAFERASDATSEAERARLLTFVLIGGGSTGVEMAGAIAELARNVLARNYDMGTGQGRARARIVLVEAGPRVLADFAPDLSANAHAALEGLGVEIRTGTRVTGIGAGTVELHGETILAGTTIWTAGTVATPVAEWLGVTPGHGGRVPVGPDLRVPGRDGVFVIGDAALALGRDGKPLPGLAPVAKQQGEYVARTIVRGLRGRGGARPFAYRDYGTLATIGRGKAVAELGRVHLTGRPAWLTWAVAHIFFLIGFRNRALVSAQWAFAYATNEQGDGLILGALPAAARRGAQPPVAKPG